jgi:WD40 repeat protein
MNNLMNFDQALKKILNCLKDKHGATNRELCELIEGDNDLFLKVREYLIFNDMAEDKKGVGLVFIKQDDSDGPCPDTNEKLKVHSETNIAELSARKYKIFISYGRNDAEELARKIASDLINLGHDIWLDKQQIRTGQHWEEKIENAILSHEIFISLLSPYAVRRPDGVCLDEISMARFHNRKIVPVMVAQCRPPLSIFRLDWVDFQEWTKEFKYERSLSRIINALQDKDNVEGSYADVFSKLKPLDFGVDLSRMTKDFTGRKWLFHEFDLWLKNSSSKVFLITGDPGIGKSAIMAQLACKHPQVMAFHFCISSLADSVNPDVFVKSIAAQLATQIKDYHEAIKQINFEQLTRLDSGTLFRRLIADPLKSIELNEQVVILIDALDESWTDTTSNIVRVLHERIEDLPDQVKVMVSSRKIPDILDLLSKYKPCEINPAYLENINDINSYLDKKFKEHNITDKFRSGESDIQQIKTLIISKSEGNFLYIKQFIHGVETGQIDLNSSASFPDGLIGIYITYFDRIYSGNENYAHFRPILEVITCLKKPFTAKELSPILHLSEFEIRRRMQTLSAFFPEREKYYSPYHKSITDWLTGEAGSGSKYLLDMDNGRKLVSEFLLQQYVLGNYSTYQLTWLPYHLIESEKHSELIDLLLDFNFIIQKCRHKMIYELIKDYHAAFSVLTELMDLKDYEEVYIKRINHYSDLLLERPDKIQNKEIIIESLIPWNEKEIADEIKRIYSVPTKRDILIIFLQFLDSQSHLLFRYGNIEGFFLQQAYNHAGSGPFAGFVDRYIKKCRNVKLLFTCEQRDEFNPFNPCLRVLQEHTERVLGVSLTYDGKYAVTGSNDNSLNLWDLQSGECLKTIRPHTSYLKALDATPNLNLVVTSGGNPDTALRLWNYKDIEPKGELFGHTGRVNAVKLTPDGRFVISGSNDSTVKVWDTTTHQCIADFHQHKDAVTSVDISLDGRIGVSGGHDNMICVWDIPAKVCLRKFEAIEDLGSAVKLSVDNKILYSCGGYDGRTVKSTIKLWDLSTGECIRTLYGHEYAINCLDITHDGKFLVSASMDKTIKVWNLNSYTCIKTIEGHIGPVVSMKITPDLKYIISGGGGKYDNTVRIWDIFKSKSPCDEFGLYRNINHIHLSNSGNFILNSCRKVIQLRDSKTGKIKYELAGHEAHIKHIWVNPEGTMIISASLDKTIKIWDPVLLKCTGTLNKHTDGILNISVSVDQKRLLSCGWDSQIIEWDIVSNKIIKIWRGHKNPITHVSYFQNDQKAVSLGSDDSIKVWNTATSECLKTLQYPVKITSRLSLASNQRLYFGDIEGSIHLWDLQLMEAPLKLKGHTELVSCLELADEERCLFSGSKDGTIRQWDLSTCDCIKYLSGHTGEIVFVRKIPGQNKIITASRDHTLRVWDLFSGKCVAILPTNLQINFLTPVQSDGKFAYGTLQGEFKIIDLGGV